MSRLIALAAVLLLAGCGQHGLFRDRGTDYLKVVDGRPLVWPDGIAPVATQDLYVVPDAEKRRGAAEGPAGIPKPPQLVDLAEPAPPAADAAAAPVAAQVTLSVDGNGFPVLMLDTGFDWAWQRIGDALKKVSSVKVDDLDRERGVYFVIVNGKKADNDDPFELKLNYTANGIQVALQVSEDAMASKDLAAPLMKSLEEALRP